MNSQETFTSQESWLILPAHEIITEFNSVIDSIPTCSRIFNSNKNYFLERILLSILHYYRYEDESEFPSEEMIDEFEVYETILRNRIKAAFSNLMREMLSLFRTYQVIDHFGPKVLSRIVINSTCIMISRKGLSNELSV